MEHTPPTAITADTPRSSLLTAGLRSMSMISPASSNRRIRTSAAVSSNPDYQRSGNNNIHTYNLRSRSKSKASSPEQLLPSFSQRLTKVQDNEKDQKERQPGYDLPLMMGCLDEEMDSNSPLDKSFASTSARPDSTLQEQIRVDTLELQQQEASESDDEEEPDIRASSPTPLSKRPTLGTSLPMKICLQKPSPSPSTSTLQNKSSNPQLVPTSKHQHPTSPKPAPISESAPSTPTTSSRKRNFEHMTEQDQVDPKEQEFWSSPRPDNSTVLKPPTPFAMRLSTLAGTPQLATKPLQNPKTPRTATSSIGSGGMRCSASSPMIAVMGLGAGVSRSPSAARGGSMGNLVHRYLFASPKSKPPISPSKSFSHGGVASGGSVINCGAHASGASSKQQPSIFETFPFPPTELADSCEYWIDPTCNDASPGPCFLEKDSNSNTNIRAESEDTLPTIETPNTRRVLQSETDKENTASSLLGKPSCIKPELLQALEDYRKSLVASTAAASNSNSATSANNSCSSNNNTTGTRPALSELPIFLFPPPTASAANQMSVCGSNTSNTSKTPERCSKAIKLIAGSSSHSSLSPVKSGGSWMKMSPQRSVLESPTSRKLSPLTVGMGLSPSSNGIRRDRLLFCRK